MLKKIQFPILTVLGVFLLFGCPSDDDDVMAVVPPPAMQTNAFNIATTSYPLAVGFRSPTFEDIPGQLWETTVVLAGSNFTIQNDELQGQGPVLLIQFYTDRANLTSGTYNLDIGNNAGEAYVSISTDYDSNNNNNVENDIFNGVVELTINGDDFIIEISGTENDGGQPFTAYYSGRVELVN
jgi:hypothetical protein